MHDVIIIGGAFSGASMGLLIKRARPDARVLIIERSVEFDRKVGESTSEVAACFLTRVLHLSKYMHHNHLTKQGLRMWFTTPDNDCLTRCTEVGAYYQTRLATFQIDRALLDEHLLELAQKEGCELWRPAKVEEITLAENGGKTQRVTAKVDGETREATSSWIVDASGKATVLSRKLGHWRRLETHPTNSIWARFRGVEDLDGYEIAKRHPEFPASVRCSRNLATNHLMGRGWWCWIIPLRNGDVSFGLTYDPRVFEPPKEGTIPERLLAHAKLHPVGRFLFENATVVENDSRAYSHLPYYSEQVAGNGWAIVGDAAGFMDPLYSQGLDYCSHSVYTAHKFIVRSLAGEDVTDTRVAYNDQFKQSYFRWFHSLYDNKYEYLGEADLVYAAFLMDLACYFIGPVRLVYQNPDMEFGMMPYQGTGGAIFARFMTFYNRRLVHIAKKRHAAGATGRENLDNRWLIKQGFIPTFKVVSLLRMGLKVWLKAEWRALFLPAVQSPPLAPAVASEAAVLP
jgi:flavin-dependent dehydrogenase